MKKYSESTTYPETFIKWDSSNWCVNYNIVEKQREEKVGEETEVITYYEYEYIIISDINRALIIEALVRNEYSVSDELAILRLRDTKQEDFNTYNTYVEDCKILADEILSLYINFINQ